MKDEEINMITDLVLDKLKNDDEVEKLKKEIVSLEDKLSFARNMAIKKSKECEELTKTIEELKKDKEWFFDRLDEQIESTFNLMNENNKLKENNSDSNLIESYRRERKLIFNAWKSDIIYAKSIVENLLQFMFLNDNKIGKVINGISIAEMNNYAKEFLKKELPCYEDDE